MTATCDELFDAVEAGAVECIVGAVTVAELLVVPLRVGPQAVAAVDTFLRQPSVVLAPVSEDVARASARLVAARVVQRLSDALIAATALELGLPLVTGDRRLARAEGVTALFVADYAA
jgi:predicted nucleic acid-binding protein